MRTEAAARDAAERRLSSSAKLPKPACPSPPYAPDRYIGLKAFADARLLFHPKRQFPILGRRFGNVKLEEIGHVLRQLEILCEQIAVGVD